jgi:hypothetical protein
MQAIGALESPEIWLKSYKKMPVCPLKKLFKSFEDFSSPLKTFQVL